MVGSLKNEEPNSENIFKGFTQDCNADGEDNEDIGLRGDLLVE